VNRADAHPEDLASHWWEYALLVLSGLLLGVGTTFFLLAAIGPVPFPIAVLFSAGGNLLLLYLASAYTGTAWKYGPLIAWAVPTVLAAVPLAGNGAVGGGWQYLLNLLLGIAVPMTALAWRG